MVVGYNSSTGQLSAMNTSSIASPTPSLQQVTNVGNTTTNDIITSGSFITNEFFSNPNVVTASLTTVTGYNSMMVSPITLSGSITIVTGSILKLI
jgi:hypothetical protein